MNHVFASSQTPDPRRVVARLWANPDTRSTLIGLLGVLLVHLLVWLLAPFAMKMEPVDLPATSLQVPDKQFNIELAPETFAQPVPPPVPPKQFKFVEANPDAPENVPDKTDNFSDRNQQVAQEKPMPDSKSDRPTTEGKKDREGTAIVTGQLTKPLERAEPVPPPPQELTPPQPVAAVPKAEQNPLPGFEKKQGDDRDGFGSNIARFPDNARPIPERIDGAKNVPLIQDAEATQPAIDPKRPQPRPQLVAQQQARSAILKDNPAGTSNFGRIAVDAKWSAYGEYLARMIEAVEIHWHDLLRASAISPQSGTYVAVKFILDSEGRITRIVTVDSHTSTQGVGAACSAITDRAPYGKWPDDMKAVLGEQQEMTFTFYYD